MRWGGLLSYYNTVSLDYEKGTWGLERNKQNILFFWWYNYLLEYTTLLEPIRKFKIARFE